jgi:ubiquinone/menaquinone biosynthesis C-methylase UbiE
MKRVETVELLDSDSGTPSEVKTSLRDLDRINRWFGGISTSLSLIERVAKVKNLSRLSVLEVAAGSGTTPRAVRERLKSQGITIELTLLDRAASHLELPEKAVVGDALKLPFSDNSFDIVSCNLFVHHLNPAQIIQFVNEALRVCRHAVIINDVERHALHVAFVYAGFPLFRSRITRHDSVASVRQAYTARDLQTILGQTAAAKSEIRKSYLFRIGAIAWKA